MSRASLRLRGLIVVLALAAIALILVFARPALPPAERGRRLAERTGCFSCHGGEGIRGSANPGRRDRTVPDWEDDLMMYAETKDQIREWIRDGVTANRARSETWRAERQRGALRMPAFGHRLSRGQIEDLVAL